jgi:gas vesicle protein
MSDEFFDFGFTFADADELDAVQEIQQKAETASSTADEWQSQAEEWRDKANKLYESMQPLLDNLQKDSEKEYIYWPGDKRVQVIDAYKLKLLSILED